MNLLDIARRALTDRSADDAPHYRWRVTLPDGTPFEVCCLPETTAAEMRAVYAGATVAPLPDSAAEAAFVCSRAPALASSPSI
jgi:hypothetical protein